MFIDQNKDDVVEGRRLGVEPICEVLQVASSSYYAARDRPPSQRAQRDPLPYKLFADEARPEMCLGCDEDHTPSWLRHLALDTLGRDWTVRVNEPLHGTYVPLRHFRRDARVKSLMLEIRRDVYIHPDGVPDHDAIARLAAATATLTAAVTTAVA